MASAFSNQIENRNFLSPIGFKFTLVKEPKVAFFCNSARIPEINLEVVQQPSYLKNLDVPGDILTYGDLSVRFLVDENMTNYLAIFNWIAGLGHPQEFEQYTSFMNRSPKFIMTESANNYSDGNLEILGSNNTVVQTVKFVDLIPTSLSGLTFATTNTDVTYITASATFEYTYFVFE